MKQALNTKGQHIQITIQHSCEIDAWRFWYSNILPGLFPIKHSKSQVINSVGFTAAYERGTHDHTHIYVGFTRSFTLKEFIAYLHDSSTEFIGAHVEICRGEPSENVAYLKGTEAGDKSPRDPLPSEWLAGSPKSPIPTAPEGWGPNLFWYSAGETLADGIAKEQGKRTDLDAVYNDLVAGMSWPDLETNHPKAIIMYHKSLSMMYSDHLQRRAKQALQVSFSTTTLRPWQEACLQTLASQSQRQISWFWDSKGNVGKTWFAQRQVALEGYLYLESGPRRDLAHALAVAAEGSTVAGICVDLTKSFASSGESSDLITRLAPIMGLLEAVKNGMVYSGKYSSKVTYLTDCKVLVVANFAPSTEQRAALLSQDRWDVHEIISL